MADEAEENSKKSNVLLIALIAVGGLLLLVVGLLVGYFLFGGNNADPSAEVEQIIQRQDTSQAAAPTEAEELKSEEGAEGEGAEGEEGGISKNVKAVPDVETFQTTYYEFSGNLTTNLKNSRKFLQVSIGVSTQYDDTVMANVDTHQVALRSEILGIMSEFTAEDIQGIEGRNKLALAIRDAINAKLEEVEGFGGVEHVHFTSFVLQ